MRSHVFKSESSQSYLIKIYVGGVNAISDEPAVETAATQLQRQTKLANTEVKNTPEVTGGLQFEVTPFDPRLLSRIIIKPLTDGYMLHEYGIKHNFIEHVVLRLCGGGGPRAEVMARNQRARETEEAKTKSEMGIAPGGNIK
ncbi:hypothetical protein BU25DRAFT_460219 [Macroventuria anomochaeta]|uniref:Uncharacterized protein n=1 Tax=Macroventuria anomochaeta TaxID=301207 RepID=A0ACB6RUN1_9PLEO|nr:uncharacterized protein BU25DRAFT_460219 [Macroventuria anomochaeta]KAF2625488.1 hypothetical protein BU25DRAFT_460219 [Macroventuria anomochaeta]